MEIDLIFKAVEFLTFVIVLPLAKTILRIDKKIDIYDERFKNQEKLNEKTEQRIEKIELKTRIKRVA